MKNSTRLLLAFCFIAHQVLFSDASGKHPLVPTLYVFRDSTVDLGKYNHLNTIAHGIRWPYGIDLNNVRGRHTNGKMWLTFWGECLSLAQQVKYFTITRMKDLPKALKTQKKVREHLAKSIYYFSTGLNDYHPDVNNNITSKFSSTGFADHLLDEITKHIKVH
ncbi:zeta-carotene desaturase [Senna tora]|uniref:Zeta-carotene desaturase n=1 Tax=Senna tora TaxID=362788 RepID=A0A834T0V2_9FABA|nr:zeta-carotene desaturase [Senna tora]